MKKAHQGFTLIEIAIVLVIIGLLLGGVLKGQELITQSKIRSAEKEIDSVAVAVLGYRDRYRALPGDDSQAAARWGLADTGDGNGRIDGAFNAADDSAESRKLWIHLRRAGLIAGDSTSGAQPLNAVGGIVGVQNAISNGGSTLLAGIVICSSNLPSSVANAIDAAQDDGSPNRGSILSFPQDAAGAPDFGAAPTAYQDDGSTLFTLCKRT